MDWLKIALFSILDQDDEQSNNYIIASYILKNYDRLPGVSLTEISKRCNLSKAAVSRFCKELGLIDYIDLQMLIRSRHYKSGGRKESLPAMENKKKFMDQVKETADDMEKILDQPLLEELIQDLSRYDSVCLLGHLQASHVAYILRNNLAMFGKLCSSAQSWIAQKEKLSNASEHDMFIIFSASGSFFERLDFNMNSLKTKNAPKIYMITSEECPDFGGCVRRIYIGTKHQSMISNIRMNLIANYIGERFSHL